MYNAFEPVIAAKHPQIEDIKKRMLDAGCLKAQMTGSGSGVFGVCSDEAASQAAAEALAGAEDLPFVASCRTI
jgi:4-diphosphocytidyl-2C-methyl-D-erythritol kinase